MRVVTKAFGTVEVDPLQKIVFPRGLVGFEKFKDYVILDSERQPFYWLQSMDVEKIAFVLVNPFLFRTDYELNIDDNELRDIGIESYEDALVFAIVTIPADGSPMTANLQGPLVINRRTRQACQVILGDERWKTKHDIMAELSSENKTSC